uniref:Uncharacterized protein n=1 Tax=Timema genevievae TaxID=629358 RepID=A0A7R9K5Z2_TIMGE|nr:unnamed protein product [Timema genevievae]
MLSSTAEDGEIEVRISVGVLYSFVQALPLNELSQAYLENDLHRIIDLANKQSRSVRNSQDNRNAKSRRSLVPRLYGQTEREAVDSPTLPALVGAQHQLSPLCFSPQASSTRMVHGPYAPVSGGPPNKSTLVLSTSSSSEEDDSHILGYRAFSAACERSVSVVSKRLGELCKHNHLQGVRRKLQDTFVKSHSKDPPVSSQRCNHTNPQQTTATQTKPSECHKSTSPSSQETLPEHLPLSETILDPLEYLKKAFGDAPMNFNCSRTVKKNRSKEATVSTYESDMSRLLDTHVYPTTSWEHGSLQPRDRDWYSPAPRELCQRESRMYQEPEERRMSCASYPYQVRVTNSRLQSYFPCKNLRSHHESCHQYWRINPIGCEFVPWTQTRIHQILNLTGVWLRSLSKVEFINTRGSSVKDYEDEAELHFPASSATEMSPETRFASLVSSPPIVYWKRSMF